MDSIDKQENDTIKELRTAYQDFLHKINIIQKERDEKIIMIIKQAEERQIAEIKKSIDIL